MSSRSMESSQSKHPIASSRSLGPSPAQSPRSSPHRLSTNNAMLTPSSVWSGNGHATPTRTPSSITSSLSNTDNLHTSSDSFPRSLSESWSAPRPSAAAAWDLSTGTSESGSSPNRNDLKHSSLARHSRHAAKIQNKPPRYPSVTVDYSHQPHSPGEAYSYSRKPSDAVEIISSGFRGLTVGDSSSTDQGRVPIRTSSHSTTPYIHSSRGTQTTFTNYPNSTDFPSYYTSTHPTIQSEYGYPYDTYRGPAESNVFPVSHQPNAVYPSIQHQPHHPDMHGHHSSMFYDYSNTLHPVSQIYFPGASNVMFSTAPRLPNVITANTLEKQLEPHNRLPYNVHHIPHPMSQPTNLVVNSMRHVSSNFHAQSYPPVDYGGTMGLIVPPASTPFSPSGPSVPNLNLQVYRLNERLGGDTIVPNANGQTTFRSMLLEEFRTNKVRKWDLRDILGHIVEFSGDQHGSRFIQQKLETATSEEKQIIFDEIVPSYALQLMQDVFGNYVIQKLFEHGTQVQKTILATVMEGHILLLSLQVYGCRVVQKAVGCILPEQQTIFVRELESHVLKCVKDANGNHVIQKVIEGVAPHRLTFIHAFQGNVYELSTHPYGCRVLQRCLEFLAEEQTRPLLTELHKYAVNLMQDQFGNYVIQFVLEHGSREDRDRIISKLRGQMLQMARHKFASNVCEKALVKADVDSRRDLVNELMTPMPDGVSPIAIMMKDQFANYVLQRALTVSDGAQQDSLAAKIRTQLVAIRRYSSAYSKHLISIERLLEKLTVSTQESNQALALH